MSERRLIIVGGGITGLAAAHEVADVNGWHVTVLEAGHRFGGKILTSDFVGRPADAAADAFIRRVPAALRPCPELGPPDAPVSPRPSPPHLSTRAGLPPLPGRRDPRITRTHERTAFFSCHNPARFGLLCPDDACDGGKSVSDIAVPESMEAAAPRGRKPGGGREARRRDRAGPQAGPRVPYICLLHISEPTRPY